MDTEYEGSAICKDPECEVHVCEKCGLERNRCGC